MKDPPDVVINDLLCFVASFSGQIPKDDLSRLVETHFDSAALSTARQIVMSQTESEDTSVTRLIEETVRLHSEGKRGFVAKDLSSLPIAVKDPQEETPLLVKILAEVQSLRHLVNELKGGSLSPNPSSTDDGVVECVERGTMGSGCTNRSGSSPSIPNTEGSPDSPTGRLKRKTGTESAQGGASLEDTVERIKNQKKSRGMKMTESGGRKSPINESESKSQSSPGGGGDRKGQSFFLDNPPALHRPLPPFHLPLTAPNGYPTPLHHPLNLEMFGSPPELSSSGVHHPGFNNNFLRAWFALVQQAHSHNLSQGGATPLFPPPPPHIPHPSPVVKMEATHSETSASPVTSMKSPRSNGVVGGNLKGECPEEGSPAGSDIPVEAESSGDMDLGDDYPSPEDPEEWKALIEDAIDKPYVCQHLNCAKRFANKFLLKKHEFIHTGERPHQCPFCMKKFNRKDNLLRHKKTHLANAMCGVSKRRHTLVFGVSDGQGSTTHPDVPHHLFHQPQGTEEDGLLDSSTGSGGRGLLASLSSSFSTNTSSGDRISIS